MKKYCFDCFFFSLPLQDLRGLIDSNLATQGHNKVVFISASGFDTVFFMVGFFRERGGWVGAEICALLDYVGYGSLSAMCAR